MITIVRRLLPLLMIAAGALPLRAQSISVIERSIHLRLLGADARPIEEKGGTVEVASPSYPSREESENHHTIFTLDLGERRRFDLESFPVDVIARYAGETMRLRLDASVGAVDFRPGEYSVPLAFESLFLTEGIGGTTVAGQEIDRFRVPSLDSLPLLPRIPIGQTRSYRIDDEHGVLDPYDPHSYRGIPWPIAHHVVARHATIFLTGKEWDEGRYRGLLYRSDDTGRTFVTMSRAVAPFNIGTIDALFFATPSTGWGIRIDTGRWTATRVAMTNDGGATWRIDSAKSALGIVAGAFLDERRGWMVGVQTLKENAEREPTGTVRRVLTLYRTDDGGATLTPVAFPPGTSPTIETHTSDRPYVEVTPFSDAALLLQGEYDHHDHIIVERDVARLTSVPGYPVYAARADDSVAYLAYRSRQWTREGDGSHAPGRQRDTLFRSTDGGRRWEPILSLGGMMGVSFLDAQRGCIYGISYFLLTEDGGKRWRYLPIVEGGDEDDPDRYRPDYFGTGPLLDLFWIDRDRIRVFMPRGTYEISLTGFPPVRDQSESGEEE